MSLGTFGTYVNKLAGLLMTINLFGVLVFIIGIVALVFRLPG